MSATKTLDTLRRFQESEILLNQAVNNVEIQIAFTANLNAFLSAARSITLVMQKEFSGRPGFEKWYTSTRDEMKRDDIFEFFKKERNKSLKEKSVGKTIRIETRIEGSFGPGTTHVIPMGTMGDAGFIIDNESPILRDGKPIEMERNTTKAYIFEERPNDDAIGLCRTYLERLRPLVEEAYSRFGGTGAIL